ncbi:MAG: ABC transporter substrate-binding protein [Bacteroidetes bacterium]|nr:ABC transporter substrate-binding protein [Fibrella sp.]
MKTLPLVTWLALNSLVLIDGHNPARAQTATDAERRYKAAIRLVQTGQYDRARTELTAVAQREGSLAPYAVYYSAVIAFRQKNYTQARLILKELTDRYPNWRKLDEVHYLFACAAMETGQHEDALTRLQRIGDPGLKTDIDKLERYFLARITAVGRLKALQSEFPANRNVALALVDQIQRNSTDKADLELADKLAGKFGVPAGSVTARPAAVTSASSTTTLVTGEMALPAKTAPARNRNKGYFNVAIMFPFKVDEFEADRRGRANQYVFDLYEGIKLAKVKLQEEGITVNLFAYDIDNDVNRTLDVLNNGALAQIDLIVGPLYAEPNRLVTAYASQGGIPVVNPIATSSELIMNQPMAFLAQPSLVKQAEKAVTFARSLPLLRRAAVYFGASRKDSLLAAACQAELKKQGIPVVDFRRMASTDTPIGTTLSEINKPGYVFLTSSNGADGPRLLSALKQRNVNSALIATASAFDPYRNPLSTFTRRELYLLYPDYIDAARPEVTAFAETYLSKRNIIPSVYASQGYDMMLFFGRSLAKSTFQARNRTNLKSDSTDYMLSGFDYTQSNDNQTVPIVKVEGGRFVKVTE